MADADEKTKAEKLAAAKKRVAQLQKKKAGKKAGGGGGGGEGSKKAAKSEPVPAVEKAEGGEGEEAGEEAGAASPAQEEEKHGAPPSEEPAQEEPAPEPEAEEQEQEQEHKDEPSTSSRTHGRQQSLSLQSKLRSSDFRRTSVSSGQQQQQQSSIKSPSLPPLSPEGDYVPEVFRKQAQRLEELERDNKRLEREVEEAGVRWKRSEEQLEDLRETGGELVELRERVVKAEKRGEEVERMKAEITALQRQNSLLHTKSHRATSSVSVSGNSESPPSALLTQLDSKSATIEAMELEISNLRAQLNSQSTTTSTTQSQITALEEKLSRAQDALEKSTRELTDTKHALTRAAEKAVKEGVDKTSTETLIKTLQRQLEESQTAQTDADKKIDTLEKKLAALGNLHKEAENRTAVRLRERDKFEKDAAMLKRKLVTIENENLRLKEERERMRKREASGGEGGAEDGLDELEDEERMRLEKRVRELEGENFDLRRGIWKERKRELSEAAAHGEVPGDSEHDDHHHAHDAGAFDDVDLIGGVPSGPHHSRLRSLAAIKAHQQQQQKHSSFSTVLSSGLAAFTGTGSADRASVSRGGGLGFISEKGGEEGEDDGGFLEDEDDGEFFDEEAFAEAQRAEERRKRAERDGEVKKELEGWKGWRLDLVECRYGAQGAGVGMGEIFEV
ncbi:hypothetical protein FQN50_007984 [Emmonsiellopsis sp. PD_5]|nr:hypothetical protein FQN50_007984 [Emmonsiellopsis sp. PD_5]